MTEDDRFIYSLFAMGGVVLLFDALCDMCKEIIDRFSHPQKQTTPRANPVCRKKRFKLPADLKLPDWLESEVEVIEADGKLAVYRGRVFNIRAERANYGAHIEGRASIEKLSRTVTEGPRFRRPYWWMPWIKERLPEDDGEVIEDTSLWIVYASEYGRNWRIVDSRILFGIPTITIFDSYRSSLIDEAKEQDILLSEEILDKVFDPIEKECLVFSKHIARRIR